MQKRADFSVVTASYNQRPFLEEAIDSVLSQRNVSVEYIIIDGGSTDGSVDIIKRYQQRLAYWVSERDLGCPDALNKGMRLATGKYFLYINSDDFLLPDSLKSFIDFVETRKHSADIFLAHGIQFDQRDHSCQSIYSGKFSLRNYLGGRGGVVQQGAIFILDAVSNTLRFNVDNRTCWDTEFLVDAALLGLNIQRLPFSMKIGCFRLHDASISGSGSRNAFHIADIERIKQRIISARPDLARYDQAQGLWRGLASDPELALVRALARLTSRRI